jgi:hypothetical protein
MGAGMERVDPLLDSRVSTFGAEAENADVCGGFRSRGEKYSRRDSGMPWELRLR